MTVPGLVQVPRYAEALKRLLGLKDYPVAPTVATELLPVLVAEQLTRPEFQRMAGVRIASGSISVPADAGNVSNVQLLNPAGSNTLVVVERCVISAGAASVVVVGFRASALTTLTGNTSHRDTRNRSNPGNNLGLRAQVRTQLAPATLVTTFWLTARLSANQFVDVPMDVVLAAGDGMVVSPSAVNLEARCTFFWRERPLEPSER